MSFSGFSLLQRILLYLKVFVLLVCIFLGFSLLSVLIPDAPVRKNIEKSIKDVINQPDYPDLMIKGDHHRLDYTMDGQISNIIYTVDNQEPLKSALLGRCRMEDSPYTSQWNHLSYNISHNNLKPNVNYARYWHGNSFFFRIFYSFTDFNEIKWLIFFITSVLMAAFAMLLYRETGGLNAMAMLAGLFFVNVYIMQFSMQMSPVLIISIIAGLFLISRMKRKKGNIGLLFFITGAVTTYFDLLTAPLLTLGLPMLIWVSMNKEEGNLKKDVISGIQQLVGFGLLWSTGYLGAWVFKVLITIPFADFDIFADVKNQFLLRSGSEGINRMSAIEANFNFLPLVFINIILLIFLIFSILFFKKRGISRAILFLAVAVVPYIWFYITANHSIFHNWFTYRIQAIAVSGVFMAVISLVDWQRFSERWNRIFKIQG
jgi:hypothetical protein